MKRCISIALLLSMIFMLVTPISSFADDAGINISGKVVKSADINNFVSTLQFTNTEENANLFINENYQIGDSVNLQGNVSYADGTKTQFDLNGELFNSIRNKDGIESYSGKIEDSTGNFDVAYFFIKKNNATYQYTLNKELTNEPIIQIYLKNHSGDLLLFESKLDVIAVDDLSDISLQASPNIDFLWFTNVSTPSKTSVTPGIQPFGTTYISTSTISRTSTYAGQQYKENVRARVDGHVTDVGSGSNAMAYTTLTLEESTYIDGSLYSNTSNFTIHNGATSTNDLIGKIGLGYNSMFNYSQWYGTYTKYGLSGEVSLDFGIGFAGKLLSAALPLSFSYNSSKVENTNSNVFYASGTDYPKTAMVKLAKTQKMYLEDDGDNITLVSWFQTIDSSLAKNYSTSAKFGWTFGVYYYGEVSPVSSFTDFGTSSAYKVNVG